MIFTIYIYNIYSANKKYLPKVPLYQLISVNLHDESVHLNHWSNGHEYIMSDLRTCRMMPPVLKIPVGKRQVFGVVV